jgi:hypothetical protein
MDLIMKKLILAAGFSALSLGAGYAQADSITQTFSQGLTLTDWSKNFNINQFDSKLGTLNGVVFSFSGSSDISATITNVGTSSVTNGTFTGTSLVYADIGGLYSGAIDASLINYRIGNVASGATLSTGTHTTTATTDTQTFISGLNSWIGSGAIAGSLSTSTGFGFGGRNSSNLTATLSNFSQANLTVTYDYTAAAPVPEPEEWALMLAGLPLVGWKLRNRKAGNVVHAVA